jgi:hypothetical protein
MNSIKQRLSGYSDGIVYRNLALELDVIKALEIKSIISTVIL